MSADVDHEPARAQWRRSADAACAQLVLSGAWVLEHLPQAPVAELPRGCTGVSLHGASDLRLDTAGACLLVQTCQGWERDGIALDLSALPAAQRRLLHLVRQRMLILPPQPPRPHAGLLGDIGRASCAAWDETLQLFAFIGQLTVVGLPMLFERRGFRWRELLAEIDVAGLHAIGIIGLLSFLIGMVMAYQGGATLSNYGANVLLVNLVAIITLREMAPLLTAVLVAGRTGSAWTARLGTMVITEELDALRALGLPPLQLLVLPRVLALLICLPLLTLLSDLMGLFGGGVVAKLVFGLPWALYVDRIPQVVGAQTLMLGLIKAPVFALAISAVACLQGLGVRGGTAAVGRATTASVVRSVFLVIVIDALFSIAYKGLGV